MNTAKDRAIAYIDKMPSAISGQGGDKQTFIVACKAVQTFGLNESDAMDVMRIYNQRCQPSWTEKELLHKVRSAASLGSTTEDRTLTANNSVSKLYGLAYLKVFNSQPPKVIRKLRINSDMATTDVTDINLKKQNSRQ